MIGNKLITKSEQKSIRKLPKAFPVQTANKVVFVSREVKVFIKTLNVHVWAGILGDAPAALSLGILVAKDGFDFFWKRASNLLC